MNPLKTKKSSYQKIDFSDEEIYQQIADQIRDIKDKGLKYLEEAQLINDLYQDKKQEKRKRKMLQKDTKNRFTIDNKLAPKHISSDEEEGQINEQKMIRKENLERSHFDGVPSISNLGDHIRPLTLTRNRLVDFLNSRRFQELVKGCFVRYLSDVNGNSNANSYIIAQIVGVTEGQKQYLVNNVKTKILLKLQQTSEHVVTLSIQLISNQHPPGGLEIQKWLQTNRNKIPKEKELKEKLDEHNKLLIQQLSSSEIDNNILKKAKKIAESHEELREDITHLIDFLAERLDSQNNQIEQEQLGRKDVKADLLKLKKDREETIHIWEKLKAQKERYLKMRMNEKKSETLPKEKYLIWNLSDEKRTDAVNDKCKAKQILLSTFEGYLKVKSQLIENHLKYEIDFEI